MRQVASDSHFFSVPKELIPVEKVVPYNIYINSSADDKRLRYVRIYPAGEVLTGSDLLSFEKKYAQLYVHESERDIYLDTLTDFSNVSRKEKMEVVKGNAVCHLSSIFLRKGSKDNENLGYFIKECRSSVESLLELTHCNDIGDIQKLIGTLSFHDFYTFDHSINVSIYSMAFLKAIKPSAERRKLISLGLGSLFHDLGKIKVPTELINKADKLSEEEFCLIKKHPEEGHDIFLKHFNDVKDLEVHAIKRIILEHHENFDGSGYPLGLKGEEIHFYARIVAIADFFDAVTTKRSYHKAMSPQVAIDLMNKTAGKKVDPKLFELFRSAFNLVGTKEKDYLELEEGFDPCQPQNVLPLKSFKAKKQKSDIFSKEDKEKKAA
ncbi:MAG: HD-GYP domain-containing protein [Bdellovibrionota bacterium]|nr:HD-GYP domain-containing protein [Bdellovibrionota bacterium]